MIVQLPQIPSAQHTNVEDIALAHDCHFDDEEMTLSGRAGCLRDVLDELNEKRIVAIFGSPRRIELP